MANSLCDGEWDGRSSMGYRNLKECVDDLQRTGQLVRIEAEIDPRLEAAEIQRRVYAAGGPAVYYANVKNCQFPMVSNLFGTIERTRFLFRDTLKAVRHLVEMKVDPTRFWRAPWRYRDVPGAALTMLPRRVRTGPILRNTTQLEHLPQMVSWPNDGGPFVTLPAVYTENPECPGLMQSNLGMYRVQLGGNDYAPNREVGMHYQIHRSIGVHHAAAIRRGEPLKVNVHIGGPPAFCLSAVMPLPEGLSELTFAGALGGRAVRMVKHPGGLPIYAESDFCITGTIDPERTLPEGPFGDHLGYYSLTHDFPVMAVENVYHRDGAIWPFTVVGRPPQEDTSFGAIIHEITGPAIPTVIPGVHAVHAVDAAGVHPLLLAIGSERYVPYASKRKPQELLTVANAILGQGQLSLAKYLWIAAREDQPDLDIHDISAFLQHMLQRVDWASDLHFQTRTTIDTLDYSGSGFNEGSKVVIAAAGLARRTLPTALDGDFRLPIGWKAPHVALPGVLVVEADVSQMPFMRPREVVARLAADVDRRHSVNRFPLIVVVDDSKFAAETLNNLLWVAFTRSNPAADIYGIESFTQDKHWGCAGSLMIDARIKPHHAEPLVEDPAVSRRVDELAAPGGPLHGLF